MGFGVYQFCVNRGSVGRVIVLRWCMWGVGRGLELSREECGCIMFVWAVSLDSLGRCRSRYLYIVLGRYLRILGAPSALFCWTLSTSQIQICLCVVVGPGLWPASQKRSIGPPFLGVGGFNRHDSSTVWKMCPLMLAHITQYVFFITVVWCRCISLYYQGL